MATQTIIDGGKQAITFNNDTEPLAIYVNGELQQNVSFVPQMVPGTGVVSYISEYKKNLLNLQVSGNTTQRLLPNEYQQVEYIESTGTQYIDTGIVASPLFEMVAVAQYTENYAGTSGNAWSGTSVSPSRIGFGYASSISSSNFAVLFASTAVNTGIPFDTNKHKFVIQGNVTGKWNIDGSTGNATGNVDSEFSKGTLPFILFARNAASGIGAFFKMRLYSFKFTDNNVLIRDFIPCYRKTDGEIGLYDLINNVFYTNKGTGTFVKGTDYYPPPTPDYPQEIENTNSEGMSVVVHYEPYFREEITIPASVDVTNNGTTTTVQLPFSIYDKLTVDRVANEVIYHQGAGYKQFRGTEAFGTITMTRETPRFTILPSQLGFPALAGNGYCSHFKPNVTMYFKDDPIDYGTPKQITFLYDAASVADFQSWVASQYSAGTPLTILAEFVTPIPHNITNTTLGQSLLNLATQNQTNYFEVTGNANAPLTPIKLTYAKWGELVENNNNT